MITQNRAISIFFVLAVLSGCASTNVTQQTPMVSPELARPNQIWVYDFIADPAKCPRRFLYPRRPQCADYAPNRRGTGNRAKAWSPHRERTCCGYPGHGSSRSASRSGSSATSWRGCNAWLFGLGPGRQWGQAFCDWIWRGEFGDGYGGRRLCDDAPRAYRNLDQGRLARPEARLREL